MQVKCREAIFYNYPMALRACPATVPKTWGRREAQISVAEIASSQCTGGQDQLTNLGASTASQTILSMQLGEEWKRSRKAGAGDWG